MISQISMALIVAYLIICYLRPLNVQDRSLSIKYTDSDTCTCAHTHSYYSPTVHTNTQKIHPTLQIDFFYKIQNTHLPKRYAQTKQE